MDNLKRIKRQVEAVLSENNTEAYIASSKEAHWTGCTYGEVLDKSEIQNISHNLISFSIFNKANAGITAHVTYDKDTEKYTMYYRYFLIDFYDFSFAETFERLDAYGFAKSYELFGVVEGELEWQRNG